VAVGLGPAGCGGPASAPVPSAATTTTATGASTPTQDVPFEPPYRPPPGSATLSVGDGQVSRGAGIAVLFHPAGGAVTVTIRGSGAYRLCPSDATGLPVSGAASSSWGPAWPAGRCRPVAGGVTVRLPAPPDAHVGVLLLAAAGDGTVSLVEVEYRPRDAFAAYRLGRLAATPTLLAAGSRVGTATATVYDDCSGTALYRVGSGPEQPTCRSTVSGTVRGRPIDGVLVRAAGATGTTPLVVVSWPPPRA